MGPFDHLRLLGDDRDGEALHPLALDASFGRHLGDGPASPELGLNLAGCQAAVGAGAGAAPLGVVTLLGLVAVAHPLGLGDGGEQGLVEGHHVPARLRALARAEDEAIQIGREADEVEFLHARP